MRLMWITPECPYPPNTGGRVGNWKRLENMGKTNDISLYSICDSEGEYEYKAPMLRCCKCVKLYRKESKISTIIGSLAYPYPAVSRWNKRLRADLSVDFEVLKPDYVIVDYPQMIGALPKNIISDGRIVLNQHNIEYQSLASLAENLHGVKKILYETVSKQMKHYEELIYRKFPIKLYTFVSESDKFFFENRYGIKDTLLVPVGMDYSEQIILNECHNLIFVAKMSYPANAAGAIWLANEILPKVKKTIPDAQLYLVGKDPGENIKELTNKNPSIVVTGTVDSLEDYYAKCNVAVVPIMTGGGVNVKLLEALGYGKLVVTTTKGIEGTVFKDGEHLRVADSADDFAAACVDMLLNPKSEKNVELRCSAHKLLETKYSWKGICANFESALKEKL